MPPIPACRLGCSIIILPAILSKKTKNLIIINSQEIKVVYSAWDYWKYFQIFPLSFRKKIEGKGWLNILQPGKKWMLCRISKLKYIKSLVLYKVARLIIFRLIPLILSKSHVLKFEYDFMISAFPNRFKQSQDYYI